MGQIQSDVREVRDLDILLERDSFLRNLIRELTGLLENMVGLEQASGFISVVGQNIGAQINQMYREKMNIPKLGHEQVADVLVDLKRRIYGSFSVESQDKSKLSWSTRFAHLPNR